MKQKYEKMLLDTGIEGMGALLRHMEEGGFFTSPCSSKYHLCKEGGLLEHSLNVLDALIKADKAFDADLDYTDMVVCALLHDLGKMGDFNKPNYVQNVLKSGKVSEAEPYKINKELIPEEHEIRSVYIASRFIELTEEQIHAIIHHNGMWGKLDNSFGSTWDKCKLSFLLHMADMWASRFVEE